jgi:hypothetical protein
MATGWYELYRPTSNKRYTPAGEILPRFPRARKLTFVPSVDFNVTVVLLGTKAFALQFRLRVGEVRAGLGEGEDLALCEGADDRACVANTECA